MLRFLRQLGMVTALNLRTLPQRTAPTLVAVAGFAGVVLVFVGVLSIREGFTRTLAGGGSPDTAVVLRGGSTSELSSSLSQSETRVIGEAPGVAAAPGGPMISPEVLVVVDVAKRTTGTDANVPFRGATPAAFELRDDIAITNGRRFEPGLNEVIVGRQAAQQFSGLDVGAQVQWGRITWTVTGHFSAGGGLPESEIWAGADMVQAAYNRGNSFQVVYARLESADSFDMFSDALQNDPRLNVSVQRENEYLASQTEALGVFITVAGTAIAMLMGLGAIFGAINTMYITVAARAREIATLRALGFGRAPLLAAVLLEGMTLGLAGGVVGGAVAYMAFNGYQASTLNFESFTQVSFAFAVTRDLLVSGINAALLMGLLGGLLPGLRAARMPAARALREL